MDFSSFLSSLLSLRIVLHARKVYVHVNGHRLRSERGEGSSHKRSFSPMDTWPPVGVCLTFSMAVGGEESLAGGPPLFVPSLLLESRRSPTQANVNYRRLWIIFRRSQTTPAVFLFFDIAHLSSPSALSAPLFLFLLYYTLSSLFREICIFFSRVIYTSSIFRTRSVLLFSLSSTFLLFERLCASFVLVYPARTYSKVDT